MTFVLSLRKSRYMYQFGQYAWTHMILLVTTVPSSFFVANVFSGIIWYVLPAFLIIANDIFAYLAGARVALRARQEGGRGRGRYLVHA